MSKYRTIVCDPPWAYRDKLGPKHRGADAHYVTAGVEDIATIPVGEWADDDAHMYLWTTNAFMCEGHDLARRWGFIPRTILTWVKPQIGMGHFYRNNTEHVVFAVRGKLQTARNDCPTAFYAPRGRHSEKPAAFYDMVESMSPGPYLDVFARKHRFGWDAYGNEVYNQSALLETLTAEQAQGLST